MTTESFKKFGEELKNIREQKDIPLQQIFQKTRIDIKFIQAIEEGNFEVMPEVYIKAFIKEYAKAIDADPESIIKKYESAKLGKLEAYSAEKTDTPTIEVINAEPQIKKEFISPVITAPVSEPTKKKLDKQFIYLIAAAVTIISILIVYFVFIKFNDSEIIKEKPLDEIVSESEQRYEMEKETVQTPDSNVQNVDSLSLIIGSDDTCWIGADIDNSKEVDFILYPGQKREIKAKTEFNLIIGNTGTIVFTLNGNKVPFEGKKGSRKNIIINSSGIVKVL